jgi:hypothetical protein
MRWGIRAFAVSFLAVFGVAGTANATITTTYSNPAPIAAPAGGSNSGPFDPYASTIPVSGSTGLVTKATVVLNRLSHPNPDDLDLVLVDPGRVSVMLMSDACGAVIDNATLTFDDAAPGFINDSGPCDNGIFKPSDFASAPPDDIFPSSLATPPFLSSLGSLNGRNPNGEWSLIGYDDDAAFGGGTISGGWSLVLTTDPSNAFTIGGLTKKKNGTGTLEVTVPGPGEVSIDDAGGSKSATTAKKYEVRKAELRSIRGRAATPGPLTLDLLPTASAIKQRYRRGKAIKTSARVTYTPDGGTASAQALQVTLKKAKKAAKKAE